MTTDVNFEIHAHRLNWGELVRFLSTVVDRKLICQHATVRAKGIRHWLTGIEPTIDYATTRFPPPRSAAWSLPSGVRGTFSNQPSRRYRPRALWHYYY